MDAPVRGRVGPAAVSDMLALVGALLVLLWVRLSGKPWREIGYVRPRSWAATVAIGVASGVAFKIVMKSVVMPLFGAPDVNQAYHFLAGNRAVIPEYLFIFIVVAGIGEETVYRGFLFERLGKLLGHGTRARIATVLLTSTLFALIHYPEQGLAGSEQAAITGLVFGTIFAITGQLPLVMVMHAAFDLTAYAMIYWNLETTFAHAIFK